MPFKTDDLGRTELFFHAASGNIKEVERIIFSLVGTGMCPQRLSMIMHRDNEGKTAADLAEENGHTEIVNLLKSEECRMSFFE